MNLSRLLSRSFSVLALGMLTVSAQAQTTVLDEAAHAKHLQQRAAARDQARADIAQSRSAMALRHQEEEKACWQRFAVQDCLNKVRKDARAEEQPLHERELNINREERQDKATERLRVIEQKQREKQVPAPVVATPRDGSGPLNLESRQSDAQKRAIDQAQRVRNHEAAAASQRDQQAQDRAQKVQAQKEKQAAAEARRASKAQEIEAKKAPALPIPEIPKP